MDAEFSRLLTRHLERCRRIYGSMLDAERIDINRVPDHLRIAALEDALDDIELLLDKMRSE